MIVAAAVLPHPPILLDALAGSAAGETTALRAAVARTAADLAAVSTRWLAVGADPRTGTYPSATRGSFVGFGAAVEVALGPDGTGTADPDLPLPLLVAGLVRPPQVAVSGLVLAPDTPTAECLDRGRALAEDAARDGRPLGLLVLGDGAATHTPRAPGAFDPRAAAFDDAVARALGGADGPALAALDPGAATVLGARGRVAWQILAGAAEVAGPFVGDLRHSGHPYGVAYHVALWRRRGHADASTDDDVDGAGPAR